MADKVSKIFNLIRYSKKAWMKSYPSSDEAQWYSITQPDNVYDFIDTAITGIENEDIVLSDNDVINVVTLDDNYFTFLKENNLEDCPENRMNYPMQLNFSNKDLVKLAKDNDFMRAYTLLTIPIVVIKESVVNQTNYILSKEQIDELTAYFETIHGKGNVFFYGNFIALADIKREMEKIIANGILYFEKNIRFEMPQFRKQRYGEKVNLIMLGIPFLVKAPVKKMSFKLSEIDRIFNNPKYVPDLITSLTAGDSTKYNANIKYFDETNIYKKLSKNKEFNVAPIELPVYDIEQFIDEVISQL